MGNDITEEIFKFSTVDMKSGEQLSVESSKIICVEE